MLNTLAAAAALAAPLSTVRRLNFVLGFSFMIMSPSPESVIFHSPLKEALFAPFADHQRKRVFATSLPRFTSRDDRTMDATTRAIAKMPAAAAVGSNL